jgi:hypothetical protein
MKRAVTGVSQDKMKKTLQELGAAKGLQLDIAERPGEFADSELAGADICVISQATAIPALMDTMTSRAFFERIKNQNITTVMTAVRPVEGDEPNWMMYMGMVLPYVDIFYAPYNEALWMLERDCYDSMKGKVDAQMCDQMALSMLNMGCAIVVLDLGEDGYYLRTTSVRPRLGTMGACSVEDVENWWAREIFIPRFESDQSDAPAAVMGLACAMCAKLPAQKVLALTAGVGCAANDSSWNWVESKLADGWKQYAIPATFAGWKKESGLCLGPNDKVEA